MDQETHRNTIAQQLCQFARANLVANAGDFNEHSLLAEVGIDSYSLVELLLFSERTFGVRVPESHLTHENLASLVALARCIARLDGAGEGPQRSSR
jgi:acyl carrier protein